MAISFSTESVKHGPTRNPWDLQRGVGGSSGGAAALVAAGAVPLAHGNDGAGSIRIPASCCGLVGLKPSRGRTPCGPDTGEALFGVAAEFGLTRTVRDAAHLLDAIHGPGVGDKYTAPPPRGHYADELGLEPSPLQRGSDDPGLVRGRRRSRGRRSGGPSRADARGHGSPGRRCEPRRGLGSRHAQHRRRDGRHRRTLPHGPSTPRPGQDGSRLQTSPQRGQANSARWI